MKTLHLFFFIVFAMVIMQVTNLPAQQCEYWSAPRTLTDSSSDNRNAVLATVNFNTYYVFWERLTEESGSEIDFMDFYGSGGPQTVIAGNGFNISNPQVISADNWYLDSDTMAFIFYQTDQSGNEDIFFTVMADTGFTVPASFASSTSDESHLRVRPTGGMVWQEGDMIRFSRLFHDNSGFHFEPVVTIDSDECFDPDISSDEQYIAWEKGNPESPQICYSSWSYENDAWNIPVVLFDDGNYFNISFSKGLAYFPSWVPILLSDHFLYPGEYNISAYDFYFQDEFNSEFSQSEAYEPDFFTIDILTQDYWETGYLAFKSLAGPGTSDIFSSDGPYLEPESYWYCRIDSTAEPDVHPQLFEGAWHFSYFDLVCVWESWRNGHWQLFSSISEVVIGSVPETVKGNDLNVRAYPNPVNDFVWLEYESEGNCDISTTFYNMMGEPVKKLDNGNSVQGKNIMKIDVGDLPAGIYLVRMEAGKTAGSLRIIKR